MNAFWQFLMDGPTRNLAPKISPPMNAGANDLMAHHTGGSVNPSDTYRSPYNALARADGSMQWDHKGKAPHGKNFNGSHFGVAVPGPINQDINSNQFETLLSLRHKMGDKSKWITHPEGGPAATHSKRDAPEGSWRDTVENTYGPPMSPQQLKANLERTGGTSGGAQYSSNFAGAGNGGGHPHATPGKSGGSGMNNIQDIIAQIKLIEMQDQERQRAEAERLRIAKASANVGAGLKGLDRKPVIGGGSPGSGNSAAARTGGNPNQLLAMMQAGGGSAAGPGNPQIAAMLGKLFGRGR